MEAVSSSDDQAAASDEGYETEEEEAPEVREDRREGGREGGRERGREGGQGCHGLSRDLGPHPSRRRTCENARAEKGIDL